MKGVGEEVKEGASEEISASEEQIERVAGEVLKESVGGVEETIDHTVDRCKGKSLTSIGTEERVELDDDVEGVNKRDTEITQSIIGEVIDTVKGNDNASEGVAKATPDTAIVSTEAFDHASKDVGEAAKEGAGKLIETVEESSEVTKKGSITLVNEAVKEIANDAVTVVSEVDNLKENVAKNQVDNFSLEVEDEDEKSTGIEEKGLKETVDLVHQKGEQLAEFLPEKSESKQGFSETVNLTYQKGKELAAEATNVITDLSENEVKKGLDESERPGEKGLEVTEREGGKEGVSEMKEEVPKTDEKAKEQIGKALELVKDGPDFLQSDIPEVSKSSEDKGDEEMKGFEGLIRETPDSIFREYLSDSGFGTMNELRQLLIDSHQNWEEEIQEVEDRLKKISALVEDYQSKFQKRINELSSRMEEARGANDPISPTVINDAARDMFKDVLDKNVALKMELENVKLKYEEKIQANAQEYALKLGSLQNTYDQRIGEEEDFYSQKLEQLRAIYEEDLNRLQVEANQFFERVFESMADSSGHHLKLEFDNYIQRCSGTFQELDDTVAKLSSYTVDVSSVSQFQTCLNNLSNLFWAYLVLQEASKSPLPFVEQFQKVKDVSKNDIFLDELVSTIPTDQVENGVSTTHQLDARLESLITSTTNQWPKKTLLNKLFSAVKSSLKLHRQESSGQPTEQYLTQMDTRDIELLVLAQSHLRRGSIPYAIREIEQISNPTLSPLLDQWVSDAKARYSLDEAVETLGIHLQQKLWLHIDREETQ
eukprot:TRINITY_DN10490_c0_g1_i3.p1 TRINITY_DN10490_c0_g1~~TRINITY_DN10490_c0_g1_i3.p1  ORF type:complete len:769 (-),score=227.71 TRINITY_DN10490_c0_g1_i3:79-2385(-)